MNISLYDFWQMSMREYMLKVKGYARITKVRRSELRAITYPAYLLAFKKSFKGAPLKPDEFLPIDEVKEKEQIIDKDGLLKKSFYAYNPHLKPK